MHSSKADFQKDLIAVLLKHVRETPDALALVTSDTSWTYQDFFEQVHLWKNRLSFLDSQKPVVICLHRTPRLLSILFALQWLEIPYIPVEIKTPLERMRAMIEDSRASVLLHDTAHYEAYSSLPCKAYAVGDLEQSVEETHKKTQLPRASAVAYVIYTSGSTGTPKGVSVGRRALNHFLACMGGYFLHAEHEMLLATTTISFDIAALELYLPIWQGKTIFLANQKEHKDPDVLQNLLKTHPVTLLQGTPSFWNMLFYAGFEGKQDLVALCGGEPLTAQTAEHLLPCVSALWNMYGPTEATIWCSLKQIQSPNTITVGKPIKQLEMWILDDDLKPVPNGVKGELYISGTGLANGYLNREELTNERFLPYKAARGKRIYRTGDVACKTSDGEFVIFGRVDNQVKLHGYRIELEDIEAHIEGCSGVRACGVSVHEEQLIAYLSVDEQASYSESTLVGQLTSELPEFMLPKRFIYLDELPVNTSGKLNRKALPVPKNEESQENQDLTSVEAALIRIWCEALNLSSMSVRDNFFELGGHSLLAARIVSKVQKDFGKKVTIKDIYQAPSIREFVEVLHSAPDVVAGREMNKTFRFFSWMPLTDFQFVLWASHLFAPDAKKLNVVGRRRVSGPLNQAALNLALQALIRKHDVLSYTVSRFIPIQKRKTRVQVKWLEASLCNLEDSEAEEYLNQSMQELYVYHGWNKQEPLIQAKVFYLRHGRIELQVAMPHMVSDQQSLGIFFQDLSSAYLFYLRDTSAELYPESEAFESYARYEQHSCRSSLTADEHFWRGYLEDAALLAFPKRHVISGDDEKSYSTFFPIEPSQLKKWRAFCISHAVTLNELLCGAIGAALRHSCKEEMIVPERLFINMVKSTREDPSFDEVIGCFLRTHAIKLDLTGNKDLACLAKQVQQSVLETAAHQKASSLVKFAAVGQVGAAKKRVKSMLISLAANTMSRLRWQPYYLSTPILNACKRLAAFDREGQFIVNVNIWNSFFCSKREAEEHFLGSKCEPLPLAQEDIFTISDVLDVCLLKDSAKNTSYLVLSANLKPAFREHLGRTLLDVLG